MKIIDMGDDLAVQANELRKTYRFGGKQTQALKGVSLKVKRGEIVCLLGMLVPVQFLPEPMKALAFVIPFTHGIDLARHFFLGTTTIWPVEVELGALVALLIILSVLAQLSTSYLERKAKREGLSMA